MVLSLHSQLENWLVREEHDILSVRPIQYILLPQSFVSAADCSFPMVKRGCEDHERVKLNPDQSRNIHFRISILSQGQFQATYVCI